MNLKVTDEQELKLNVPGLCVCCVCLNVTGMLSWLGEQETRGPELEV